MVVKPRSQKDISRWDVDVYVPNKNLDWWGRFGSKITYICSMTITHLDNAMDEETQWIMLIMNNEMATSNSKGVEMHT